MNNPKKNIHNTILNNGHNGFGLTLNKALVYRARTKSIEKIDVMYDEQDIRLSNYVHEMLKSNPSSNVKICMINIPRKLNKNL